MFEYLQIGVFCSLLGIGMHHLLISGHSLFGIGLTVCDTFHTGADTGGGLHSFFEWSYVAHALHWMSGGLMAGREFLPCVPFWAPTTFDWCWSAAIWLMANIRYILRCRWCRCIAGSGDIDCRRLGPRGRRGAESHRMCEECHRNSGIAETGRKCADIRKWLKFVHELLCSCCIRRFSHHSLQVHHYLLFVFRDTTTLFIRKCNIVTSHLEIEYSTNTVHHQFLLVTCRW